VPSAHPAPQAADHAAAPAPDATVHETSAPARTPIPSPEVETRWQRFWADHQTFRARDDGTRPRRYLLTMFPYPSGDLHMGHAEVFALEDVVARYWRLRGYDVLNPIGWDSFGLPAENAAIRRGEHPAGFTEENIATQAASIRRYGVSFDWSRRLETHRPEYYRWTQWLFLRLYERGLAYRADALVNWCPRDNTVLANEQVVAGRCERCGAAVERRELTQWFFRVTAYADRLLDDLDGLTGRWPARVLAMQRTWIGRSTGARVRFAVVEPPHGGRFDGAGAAPSDVEVFTTRPDTLPGVTFLAVAPESAVAEALCAPDRAVMLAEYRTHAVAAGEIARGSTSREPTGLFLGAWVRHPVDGRTLPVWAADYVLPGYGTGAVMGVPAHDERDAAFANVHGIPTGTGALDPGALDALVAVGRGEPATSYRLRDWLVSRQRYWGAPIPMVHCPVCGVVPVPDDALPVRLPDLRGADLLPKGRSPLADARDWRQVPCPACGGPAERDPDTMDTFVDSSWYFLRYCSPGRDDVPFDPADLHRWMPADLYVGGVEHAILHLLYARFVTKVLHDAGYTDAVEPWTALLNQGQVINRGRAMSKSLGNGVELAGELDRHGVDTVRLAMVFSGPPEDDVDWADVAPDAMRRFLGRALRLARDVGNAAPVDGSGAASLRRVVHRTVHDAEGLIERHRFNVVVARVMQLVSAARQAADGKPGPSDPAVREAAEAAAILLSLFAPYTAEEMWAALGRPPSAAEATWPAVDPTLLVAEMTTAVVQVGGKVRDRLHVPADVDQEELRERALASPAVRRALAGRPVARVVVRAPHLVNLVPG
jgi:leucyl-tRNA synthetase